ncbi:stomatin-like protein 1 [Tubulanus polymorphus]|uniref:stomatin-like protein 1 n=1 Tax=Tubulanus polymorphus TaxID=672921 RepID=UPI003DA37930
MSVKYSRVALSDDAVFDCSSTFDYSTIHRYKPQNYGIGIDFPGTQPHADDAYIQGRQSLLMRCLTAVIVAICYFITLITFPISLCFALKNVNQYERIVVFRLGRLLPAKGPGTVMVLPCLDRWRKIDMRMRAFNVPPQKVLTQDNGVVEAGADIYFRVNDVSSSVTHIRDLNQSLRILGQTSLINRLGKLDSDEIETSRNVINTTIQEDLNQMARSWGAEIGRVNLSEVKIIHKPPDKVSQLGSLLFPQALSASSSEQTKLLNLLAGTKASDIASSTDTPSNNTESSKSVTIEMNPNQNTPSMLIESARQALNSSIVNMIGAIYKFDLRGDDGGVYYLDAKHGEGSAGKGEPPTEPDVTLTFNTSDLQPLLSGQLEPFQAYMDGKLHLAGDMGAAMKLQKLSDWIRGSGHLLKASDHHQPGSVFQV